MTKAAVEPRPHISTPWETPPGEGAAIEVADGVLWIRLPLPMALNHVNVYAFAERDGWTLVDTGISSRRSRALWETILAGPLQGRPVTRIIVTHHHPDHIGMAGWFQSKGAALTTTRTAWLMARMLQLDEQDRPSEETVSFWKGAGMAPEILAERIRERPFNFADTVAPLPLGYTRVADGDRVTFGGRIWDVRTGGGHAPEHATFWCHNDPLVIGGDQLLGTISPNLGVYATEPEADPVKDWLSSCVYFESHARDDHLVLPGHKLPYIGLPTRLRQLRDNHDGALNRLRAFLNEPHTAAACFKPLFKREIGSGEYGLALVEAMAHVLHLYHRGEASRQRRDDGAWLWQMIQK